MSKANRFSRIPGIKFFALCCVVLTGIVTIVASGGGGGSASLETQTDITAANAEQVAVNAYEQGMAAVYSGSGSYETIKTGHRENGSASSGPQALALVRLVLDFMDRADLTPGQARTSLSSLKSCVIDGTCGGQAQITASIDTLDKEFSLDADFSDYCMYEGTILSGTMAISGKIDLLQDRILSFAVSFAGFNVLLTETGDSTTISGIMSMTLTGLDAVSGLMDLSLTDDTTGKTYVLDQFTVSLSGLVSSVLTFTLSGAFTDPDNGTFSIQTTTPFKMNKTDFLPYQGVLLIIAADNSKAELTVLSTTSYEVRADTNGDGTYDFDTGVRSW
ncbi:MAG: hypothetical protein V1793_15380 [Pseudomonadota bacterium]